MMKLSRRRFLGHVLGAGLVSAAAYGTYRGFVPGYPQIHLDYPGMDLGHAMRDTLIKRPVNIPSTDVNVLIAGSGGAGLSAAWALSKQGMHDYVVLDGPERNGVGGRVVRADESRHSQLIAFRPTRKPDARRSRRHLGKARLGRRTRGATERSSTRGRHAARTRNLPCPIPG